MATDSGSDADQAIDDEAADDDRPSVAETLEPERVAELHRAGEAQLIDVRQFEEWELGHIEGAVHIVLEEVTVRSGEVPRDGAVVFACRSGNRSAMVADAFRGDGYDAYNLAGGLLAWQEAGLPLEGDEGSVA